MQKLGIDKVLLITVIIMSLFGIIMVYSASNVIALEKYNDSLYFAKRQFAFLILGYILFVLFLKIDILKLKKYSSLIFLVCFILLVLVLIPGIGIVRGGARSWIGIGSFSIQPSEFMKLGIIILLSKYLSSNYIDLIKGKVFFSLVGFVGVIFLLIMLQPDFGTGLVMLISCIILFYLSGSLNKYYLIIITVGVLGMVLLIISAPYRLERITAFLNPWQDPLGSGFQGIQSLFAITPGGLFGHGFNKSMQKHFFLPEPQNDFIFAIIVEEFGLFGGFFVILGYFIIIYRGVLISLSVDDMFLKFLSLGIVISLFTQVLINVGVVVGLLPVTGITLPLFSYGGSSLLLTISSLSILLSISQYRNFDYR